MKRFAIFSACVLLLLSAPRLVAAQTTVIFLTSGTSWTVPNNWNNANNTVEVIGAGGAHISGTYVSAGDGGGSYSRINNLTLTPGNNVTYQVGSSGQAVTTGGATWFNGTTISNASVSAEGGCNSTNTTPCANSTSKNVGSLIYAGGKGGTVEGCGYVGYGGGGGGAAGPYGPGQNGQNAGCVGGNGGTGDKGLGGLGGAGSTVSAGSAGTEYTATSGATAGSGGGGAGSLLSAGAGGAYGAGAGGFAGSTVILGGNGLIVITYAPAPNIFATNLNSPTVTAYPLGSSGNVTPLGSVTSATGLAYPDGIARDSSGNLYVANMAAASVTIYAPGASGNAAPTATITGDSTGLVNPSGVAVDSGGNIYVANPGASAGYSDSVFVYPPGSNGNATPTATITGSSTGLANPTAITLDSSGNIYVANGGSKVGGVNSITVYPAGSNGNAQPSATISGANTGLAFPWGIALDSSRNIYVANNGSTTGGSTTGGSGSVTVYTSASNGNVVPSATISGSDTALNSPGGIAVDSGGNIYVTNDGAISGNADSITVYAPGSNGDAIPANTLFALGLEYPLGILIDSGGNLYVANDGSNDGTVDAITVYPPNGLVPSKTIGMDTGLNSPAGITLDSSGNIYVTNDNSYGGGWDSVNVYPPGSYAGGPPSSAIIGSSTGLALPFGIATNSSGSLYVTNSAGGPDGLGSVTVYPSGSNGNVAPSVTISGNSTSDNTGFNSPSGIAFDASGNLYVANAYGGPDNYGSITIYPPGSNGNVTPIATISDSPTCAPCDKTNLNFPYGVALDSSGKIYVVNALGGPDSLGSVTIFPALGSSTGTLNEAPRSTISGTSSSDTPALLSLAE